MIINVSRDLTIVKFGTLLVLDHLILSTLLHNIKTSHKMKTSILPSPMYSSLKHKYRKPHIRVFDGMKVWTGVIYKGSKVCNFKHWTLCLIKIKDSHRNCVLWWMFRRNVYKSTAKMKISNSINTTAALQLPLAINPLSPKVIPRLLQTSKLNNINHCKSICLDFVIQYSYTHTSTSFCCTPT